jgi:hypothetical protein
MFLCCLSNSIVKVSKPRWLKAFAMLRVPLNKSTHFISIMSPFQIPMVVGFQAAKSKH